MIRLLKHNDSIPFQGVLDMNSTFFYFLFAGMAAMFVVMWFCARVYNIRVWKIAAIAVFLMPAGYYGAKLMFCIEAGYWSGRSLYGAIFLVPVVMLPVGKLLKLRYGELMDVCSPAGCVMFAVLKVKCVIDGCCAGRLITIGGKQLIFPSQKVEGVVFLIIMAVVILMIFSKKYHTLVYPWFMVIYGVLRFFLNLLRETTPWIGPLPAGNFWSLISIAIGTIVIVCVKRNSKKAAA